MLSVVIPLYNKKETIERAVNSVLAQTVQDFELIVVNNGSTDGSGDIVRNFSDPRIRLVEQENQGVSMARNRGVSESTADWIAFLDADDEWRPDFLETVLALREKYPDCKVCATAYEKCNANGIISGIRLTTPQCGNDFVLDDYFETAALSDPPFCSISILVEKKALLDVGGFPKGIHQGEDLLTWARLAACNRIAYSRKAMSIFYTGEESVMGKPKRIPDANDPVGKGLEAICRQHPELKGIQLYIAHWHKMRASIYLRLSGYEVQCRAEIKESKRWHKIRKINLYTVLSLLPYSMRMYLLQFVR